jgi:hypothetical protein
MNSEMVKSEMVVLTGREKADVVTCCWSRVERERKKADVL